MGFKILSSRGKTLLKGLRMGTIKKGREEKDGPGDHTLKQVESPTC